MCSLAVMALMLTESYAQPGRDSSKEPARAVEQRVMQIGTAATATIKAVLVAQGDRVHPGQLLVTLDCRPLEAELQLRKSHSRQPKLSSIGFEAVPVLKNCRLRVRRSRAQRLGPRMLRKLSREERSASGVTVTQARADEVQNEARASAAQLDEGARPTSFASGRLTGGRHRGGESSARRRCGANRTGQGATGSVLRDSTC